MQIGGFFMRQQVVKDIEKEFIGNIERKKTNDSLFFIILYA